MPTSPARNSFYNDGFNLPRLVQTFMLLAAFLAVVGNMLLVLQFERSLSMANGANKLAILDNGGDILSQRGAASRHRIGNDRATAGKASRDTPIIHAAVERTRSDQDSDNAVIIPTIEKVRKQFMEQAVVHVEASTTDAAHEAAFGIPSTRGAIC